MVNSIYRLLEEAATQNSERPAFATETESLTYGDWLASARRLALRLRDLGIGKGSSVAIVGDHGPSWLCLSLALQGLGAVECPREAEGDEAAWLGFFLRIDCQFCLIEDPELLARLERLPLPEHQAAPQFCLFADLLTSSRDCCAEAGKVMIAGIQGSIRAEDLAVVIRSSGTTGPSKQVMLNHANFIHTARHVPIRIQMQRDDVCLLSLPLWHLYGRLVAYITLAFGARLELCGLDTLQKDLKRVRPMLFPAFPIIWIHLYHQIWVQFEGRRNSRMAFASLLAFSRTYHACLFAAQGKTFRTARHSPLKASLGRSLNYLQALLMLPLQKLIDHLVFRRIRAQLGGRLRAAIIGDAPLPLAIDQDLRALGFPVLEGYGSSEQMIVALRAPDHNVTGCVGPCLPELELKIVSDGGQMTQPGQIGEILVRGPQVFLGYRNDPQLSEQSFVEFQGSSYYGSGDLGCLDQQGYLRVVGRKVNRLALADGEFLYPESTENVLRGMRLIAHVVVFPSRGIRLLALVVPEYSSLLHQFRRSAGRNLPVSGDLPQEEVALAAFLQMHRNSVESLLNDSRVVHEYRTQIRNLLKRSGLPVHQWPSHFALCSQTFLRGRELTPTLKLRRNYIREKYAGQVLNHLL